MFIKEKISHKSFHKVYNIFFRLSNKKIYSASESDFKSKDCLYSSLATLNKSTFLQIPHCRLF